MEKLKSLWVETSDELVNKVSWPTWDDLKQSTIIVMIASLIFAMSIYIIDLAFGQTLGLFYKLFEVAG